MILTWLAILCFCSNLSWYWCDNTCWGVLLFEGNKVIEGNVMLLHSVHCWLSFNVRTPDHEGFLTYEIINRHTLSHMYHHSCLLGLNYGAKLCILNMYCMFSGFVCCGHEQDKAVRSIVLLLLTNPIQRPKAKVWYKSYLKRQNLLRISQESCFFLTIFSCALGALVCAASGQYRLQCPGLILEHVTYCYGVAHLCCVDRFLATFEVQRNKKYQALFTQAKLVSSNS